MLTPSWPDVNVDISRYSILIRISNANADVFLPSPRGESTMYSDFAVYVAWMTVSMTLEHLETVVSAPGEGTISIWLPFVCV